MLSLAVVRWRRNHVESLFIDVDGGSGATTFILQKDGVIIQNVVLKNLNLSSKRRNMPGSSITK